MKTLIKFPAQSSCISGIRGHRRNENRRRGEMKTQVSSGHEASATESGANHIGMTMGGPGRQSRNYNSLMCRKIDFSRRRTSC